VKFYVCLSNLKLTKMEIEVGVRRKRNFWGVGWLISREGVDLKVVGGDFEKNVGSRRCFCVVLDCIKVVGTAVRFRSSSWQDLAKLGSRLQRCLEPRRLVD
jgi:hypothetical protein